MFASSQLTANAVTCSQWNNINTFPTHGHNVTESVNIMFGVVHLAHTMFYALVCQCIVLTT